MVLPVSDTGRLQKRIRKKYSILHHLSRDTMQNGSVPCNNHHLIGENVCESQVV